eukprot:TRINITY_DN11484_c0_g6_i2.p1 TRINITY_DN11484_c0_g6~~TRINITY_DN11484_c0_g6_i2.p1  ORF type:complete len:302 (-),score=78.73 TRINITY_DN11484_c0_g6_i2:62-967(-)
MLESNGEESARLVAEMGDAHFRPPLGEQQLAALRCASRIALLRPGDMFLCSGGVAHATISASEELTVTGYESLVTLHPRHVAQFLETGSACGPCSLDRGVMEAEELCELRAGVLKRLQALLGQEVAAAGRGRGASGGGGGASKKSNSNNSTNSNNNNERSTTNDNKSNNSNSNNSNSNSNSSNNSGGLRSLENEDILNKLRAQLAAEIASNPGFAVQAGSATVCKLLSLADSLSGESRSCWKRSFLSSQETDCLDSKRTKIEHKEVVDSAPSPSSKSSTSSSSDSEEDVGPGSAPERGELS